ncbi:hypothetical protein VTP01DRAFT_2601 [Rhizomucor pusillus]|uniref:uncharacterized protein n=1 Tax=Rhizomucor pusillus TaxID=4840 RepID=UPI0037447AC1
MEKSLSDYDESLEALERQREELELVMQKMGQEWEISGAGIGWLNASSHLAGTGTTTSQATAVGTGGPSPGYIQSLLNLDESVLEASLTNGGKTQHQIPPHRMPMPPKTHAVASPPITPGDESGVLFAQDTATSKNVTSHKHI